MKLKSGITGKLLIWYFMFVLIFFGTVFILYLNVHRMMRISEDIVNKNYKISSASKKMIENLLNMEENEKKYFLLKKKDYVNYFISAQKEFEESLKEILNLRSAGMAISARWNEIDQDICRMSPDAKKQESPETLLIPEAVLNEWIQKISEARSENEQDVEQANRELERRGQMAVRTGLAGLGISILAGLLGSGFLARSMIGPLRELLRGIRSVSKEQWTEPIHIRSKDEFGELAAAFNEMAMRLEEEKQMRSDFISMLSHEIRTPLTSIRESVNLIGEGIMGNINERQKKFLEIANLEMGRVCDLLNRLMRASRMESGALRLQVCPIDSCSLVKGCIDQLNTAAEAKRIMIETDIPSDISMIAGDFEHLQQVFLNIMGNALKFSAAESRITVSAEPDHDPAKIRFSVSDRGPGIPEEEQTFIFNKYYRAKGVREHQDGVGLGLSISRNIIESHGGTISVISKVGQGSTFIFTLPVSTT